MRTWAIILAAGLVASAAPALAECVRPTPPAAVDGASASKEQMVAAKKAAADFLAASDAYQSCVLEEVSQQRAAAKASKAKFDEAVAKAAAARVSENQADKEKVGQDFNAAVRAYKEAHS